VARLTDAQAASFIAALTGDTGVFAATSAVPTDPNAWHPAEGVESSPSAAQPDAAAQRLRAFARDVEKIDQAGRSLTLDLAAYLRRPVRCSLGHTAPAIASSWRFGAKVDGGMLWVDIDTGLGSAFSDAMIGGDGTAPIGRGRKVRNLASIVVRRMLEAIATAASAELRGPVQVIAPADDHGPAIAGGLCAVAIDQFPWVIGVAADVPAIAQARPSPVEMNLDRSPRLERRTLQPEVERRPIQEPDEALRSAIDALDARLAELTLNRIAARPAKVERIDGADVAGPPAAALGLALTAGGNGAVVAFADAAAVSGIAGAAAGTASPTGAPGEIALAATEAVVRDALERAVAKLPAIGDEGHRVVRLSEDPLTARTPHHAVDVEVSSEGKTGTIRVLVPSWMLVNRERKGR